MLIPYKIRPWRENKIWEEVVFLIAYCFFAAWNFFENRRDHGGRMWKGKGWAKWIGASDEGPESEDEMLRREREAENVRDAGNEVAEEEENASSGEEKTDDTKEVI